MTIFFGSHRIEYCPGYQTKIVLRNFSDKKILKKEYAVIECSIVANPWNGKKHGMAETERSGKTASPKIKNKVWPRQNVLGKPHLQKSKTIKNTAGVHPATYIVNQT